MNMLILAGERPGGDPLAVAEKVANKTQIMIAGQTMLTHVLAAVAQLQPAPRLFIVGDVKIDTASITTIAPAATPCTSVLKALQHMHFPVLITTADHPLLTPTIIHEFLQKSAQVSGDVCVGLVPLSLIKQHYPNNRRTKLKFSDGSYSGANLFLLRHANAIALIHFWRQLEATRKSPWRMIRTLGISSVIRYALGLLAFADVLTILTARTGCNIAPIILDDPHAAMDVDKLSDLSLVRHIMDARHSQRTV